MRSQYRVRRSQKQRRNQKDAWARYAKLPIGFDYSTEAEAHSTESETPAHGPRQHRPPHGSLSHTGQLVTHDRPDDTHAYDDGNCWNDTADRTTHRRCLDSHPHEASSKLRSSGDRMVRPILTHAPFRVPPDPAPLPPRSTSLSKRSHVLRPACCTTSASLDSSMQAPTAISIE